MVAGFYAENRFLKTFNVLLNILSTHIAFKFATLQFIMCNTSLYLDHLYPYSLKLDSPGRHRNGLGLTETEGETKRQRDRYTE